MPTIGIGSGPGGGVNLDERYLGAASHEFLEAQGVLFHFLRRRFLTVDRGEEALNDDGALPGERKNVVEYFFERHVHFVDSVQIILSAAVELGPDLVVTREVLEAFTHRFLVEPGGIGDEHQLEKRKSAQGADVHDALHGFNKIGGERRLAIAAEGNVAEFEQFVRDALIGRALAQAAPEHEREGLMEFKRHGFDIQLQFLRRLVTMDLAIDAIEVAFFVGVHVDADGQAMSAGGYNEIDESVVHEIARAAEGCLRLAHGTRDNVFPDFRVFGAVRYMLLA